jgi:hypothetical protein
LWWEVVEAVEVLFLRVVAEVAVEQLELVWRQVVLRQSWLEMVVLVLLVMAEKQGKAVIVLSLVWLGEVEVLVVRGLLLLLNLTAVVVEVLVLIYIL